MGAIVQILLVCFFMAGSSHAAPLLMPIRYKPVDCPLSVLNALVTDASLDLGFVSHEVLPVLEKVIAEDYLLRYSPPARWAVNTKSSPSVYANHARERVLERLHGIGRDIEQRRMETLVLAVRGAQAQEHVLEQFLNAKPGAPAPVVLPRWRFTPRHFISGLYAGGTAALVSATVTDWQASTCSLAAVGFGLLFGLSHSLCTHEVAQQRAYSPEIENPENILFFRGLQDHRAIQQFPDHPGAWVYSSINFENQGTATLFVDLISHVVGASTDLKTSTWLFLRRP